MFLKGSELEQVHFQIRVKPPDHIKIWKEARNTPSPHLDEKSELSKHYS